MEKFENMNHYHHEDKEEEEEAGIKFGDLLDQARKYVEEKSHKLAEFYVSLAMLEPKVDIFNKIKSLGILTFVRHNLKDAQIMDYLIFKIKKYLAQNEIRNFDFSVVFCIIRVLYRGALVKLNDNELMISINLLKEALDLFDEGNVTNEQNSRETINGLFRDSLDKYKQELSGIKSLFNEKREELEKIKSILKRSKGDQIEVTPDRKNEFYLISVNWVNLALPFLEEFIRKTNREDELFNMNKIYSNFLTILDNKKKEGTKINSIAYPGNINNHDILQYKDYWYDYDPEHRNTNVFLSRTARENQDFFYLSKEDWDLLKSFFGCYNEILRFSLKDNSNFIDTNLIRLKILVLNKHLKENAIDYIRPRYIQVSKNDTVSDLKTKIKRCVADLFKIKLKHENHEEYSFNKVDLFIILFGMKKRMREIIRLIYSYNTQNRKFTVSANKIEDENMSVDDLEYGPGDLIIAEIDGDYIKVLGPEIHCNNCNKDITDVKNMVNCESCKNIHYCSNSCRTHDTHHLDFHTRFNKFNIKKFSLKDIFATKLEDILDTQNTRFGKVGLRNLGNTCFMNSALQCLSHCEDLTKFFLLKYHLNDINSKSHFGSGGQIANSYYELITNLWTSTCEYLSPGEFRHMLVKIVKKFQGFSQQDSHELLTYLLDSLHEDMNRNATKPYIEMKEKDESESDFDASKRWWLNHLKRENSIIVDLFHGQYKSTIMCPQCNRISITYDPFMYLGLPIPANQNKFFFKYFPQVQRNETNLDEYKFFNLDHPLSSNKMVTVKDIKIYAHHRFGETDKNNFVVEYPKFLRNYDAIVLTADKLFKRVLKDDEEITAVIEKEGEILIYEKYTSAQQLDGKGAFISFYLNPVIFKQETSMILFNKKTRSSLFYPTLITLSAKSDIKSIYFEAFKIYRQVLRDIKHTDYAKFNESLKSNNYSYLKKEFDCFFKPQKYEKIDFESESVPFDFYFLNTIPEAAGFFSSKQSCEFCDDKKCEDCRVLEAFDINQPLSLISDRLKSTRPLCILVSFKIYQKTKFFNNDPFPFNIEELNSKPIVNKSSNISIYDCLNLFRSEEKLEKENSWFCSRCSKHQEASKTMEIHKAPHILIVQLKRFKIKSTNAIMGMLRNGKNDSLVNYPLEGLNLKDFIVGPDNDAVYDLFAVSEHFGNLSSGHYTALCKNQNKWYDFDDECVNRIDEKKVMNNAAYLLFYRRRASKH